MTSIGVLTQAIFERWDRDGFAHVVLRSGSGLPEGVSGLAVLVSECGRAERSLLECASALGWRLHNRAEFAPVSLFLSSREGGQVHIDLFERLAWGGFDILSAQVVLSERVRLGSFWVPSSPHEAVLNLVNHLLEQERKYNVLVSQDFAENRTTCIEVLAPLFGAGAARRIVRSACDAQWQEIDAKAAMLRTIFMARRLVRSPIRTAMNSAIGARRTIRRWLEPPGLVIALLGPDGSGKSTVASLVLELMRSTFPGEGSRCIHWKPVVFPARRSDSSHALQPHGQEPRGRIASLGFLLFHVVEFFLGNLLRVRPLTCGNSLVVFDRHYDDLLVDPLRYRINVPSGVLRLLRSLVPQPHVEIALDAAPEVLLARKQEVSRLECARQRAAYRELAESLRNGHLLDAAKPPEAVAAEIRDILLEHLSARMRTRSRACLR